MRLYKPAPRPRHYLPAVRGLQDTSNRTFREVVGNGVALEVPRFQRDYSWDTEQWQDLWEDLVAVRENDEYHYLGFVVLQRKDDDLFSVVDGQQRLTTLSLIVLAAMTAIRQLGGPKANQRIQALRQSYIGRQDVVTLTTSNKLRLNRNNERLYRTYLTELQEAPATGLNASERLLVRGLEFFVARLVKFTQPEAIASLVETLVSRMFFTVIYVDDQLNAYRVFETLNARGVMLSAADLLKNLLFSLVDDDGQHEARLQDLELRWEEISEQIGRDKIQDFISAYWNSRHKKVRTPHLYRAIRQSVTTAADVFEFMRELARAAPMYAALRDPNHEHWAQLPKISEALRTLKLLGVRQYISLALAGSDLPAANFEMLLNDLVAFSFRYNTVMSRSSGDQETLYNKAALSIRESGQYTSDLLWRLYPNDSEFKASFAVWTISSTAQGRKLASYTLSELDRQVAQAQVITGATKVTLEHILPQSPAEGWPDGDDPMWQRAVWRLGNLTLLEAAVNRQLGQAPLKAKLEAYSTSAFQTTREVANYAHADGWSERAISERQRSLAKVACGVWSLRQEVR